MPKQVIINMQSQFPFGECEQSENENARVLVRRSILLEDSQQNFINDRIDYFRKLNNICIIKIQQILQDDGIVHILYQYVPIKIQTWVSNINEKFLQSFCKQLIEFGDYLAKCYIWIQLKIQCIGMDENYRPKYFLDHNIQVDKSKDKNSLKFRYQQQVLTLFKPFIQSKFTLKSFLSVNQNNYGEQEGHYNTVATTYGKHYGFGSTDRLDQQSVSSTLRLQQKAHALQKLRKNESINVCSNNFQMAPFEKNRKQSILSSVSNIKINRLGRRIDDIKNKFRNIYSPQSILKHEERSIQKKDNSIAFNFDSTSRIITTNKIDSASFCSNIMRDLQQQETIFQKFEKNLTQQLGRGTNLKKNERLKTKQYEQMKKSDNICIQDILSVLQQPKAITYQKSNMLTYEQPHSTNRNNALTYQNLKQKNHIPPSELNKQIEMSNMQASKGEKMPTFQLQNRVKNAINKSKNLINKFKNQR